MSASELPHAVKLKIEKTLGSPIRYARDCDLLSLDIREKLNETIGVTTIKRLFGFATDVTAPRTSTLDLLARYAGYGTYEEMTRDLCPEGDSDFEDDPDIDSSRLKAGDKVTFRYLPDRKVALEYIGGDEYRVILSCGSSLRVDDIVNVSGFMLRQPLRMTKVVRDGENLGPYVAGKVSGLTELSLEET